MIKGVPISPGVVVAPAFRIDAVPARSAPVAIDAAAAAGEIARFEAACRAAVESLDGLIARVSREVGEDEASIFRAHRLLIRDPALVGKVKSAILNQRLDAPSALSATLDEYGRLFDQIRDEYLRERMSDIRDVVGRLMEHLAAEQARRELTGGDPVIVVTDELLPSQAAMFDNLPVAGIATQAGGATGHAAILSRALGIPAVSDLAGLLDRVRTGDVLVLDGREGVLIVTPGPEVEAAYRKLGREFVDLRDRLVENRDQEPVTADGVRLELSANVNSVADAVTAARVGACGVGLFRTEYLFLTHPTVPDEEEQVAHYRRVIEAAPNRSVTIRTLDLGGDKQVPYLGGHREANPFLGWRSIRLSSAFPEFFRAQLRAILRAGPAGDVKVLFPMVSNLEEVLKIKETVAGVKAELQKEGVEFAASAPLGIMVEVPAAALCIDRLLPEVDFVSIGSNDLIQYVMAADRDNPKVAHLCEPFGPAIFRLLRGVIEECVRQGKPVTLCGEMAGRPRCLLPLAGMGLRHFSMSPAFVPSLKETARSMTLAQAKEAADAVATLGTVREVREYLGGLVAKLCPSAAQLDVH